MSAAGTGSAGQQVVQGVDIRTEGDVVEPGEPGVAAVEEGLGLAVELVVHGAPEGRSARRRLNGVHPARVPSVGVRVEDEGFPTTVTVSYIILFGERLKERWMAEKTAARLDWQRVRDLASSSPLLSTPTTTCPLINPLWSTRELRGRIERVIPETDDAATLIIKPGGVDLRPPARPVHRHRCRGGGSLPLAVLLAGSVPVRGKSSITITVRAMPEGSLSDHLVRGLEPGTIVRLAAPAGEFTLPDPPPEKSLFLVAGSGSPR